MAPTLPPAATSGEASEWVSAAVEVFTLIFCFSGRLMIFHYLKKTALATTGMLSLMVLATQRDSMLKCCTKLPKYRSFAKIDAIRPAQS
jgi:hypothetical protein